MLCCVFHQLGEQVSHLAGLGTGNVGLIEGDRNDALVVLDFADGDSEHFAKRHCWTVTLGGLCVGENKEALRVAVHAGCEVVDSVQE